MVLHNMLSYSKYLHNKTHTLKLGQYRYKERRFKYLKKYNYNI